MHLVNRSKILFYLVLGLILGGIYFVVYECNKAVLNKEGEEQFSFELKTDSIIILKGTRFEYTYSSDYFMQFIGSNHEFSYQFPLPPRISYTLGNNPEYFSSLVGEDEYYLVYAHFLSIQNNGKSCFIDRINLHEMFLIINNLYTDIYLSNGFGHLRNQIPGHVEFSILEKIKIDKNNPTIMDSLKDNYISSLKNFIHHELDSNLSYRHFNASLLIDEKLIEIEKLDSLISNSFYLNSVMNYHFSNY